MKGFFTRKAYISLKIFFLIVSSHLMLIYLWPKGNSSKLLFLTYLVITLCSLFFGTLASLIITLIFIFFLGSFYMFDSMHIVNSAFIERFLHPQTFLIYGFGLLITSMLGGNIQHEIRRMVNQIDLLKQEVEQFVAIDTETFFDNAQRMEIELQREMKRIDRYGGKFTVLFLELDYYKEFLKAYGQEEMEHLLKTIGEKVSNNLRLSDKKFRYSENKFAFFLIETPKEHVDIVAEKLANCLKIHQLKNGKTVTLNFHVSYGEYNSEMKEINYKNFIEEIERETVFYDL